MLEEHVQACFTKKQLVCVFLAGSITQDRKKVVLDAFWDNTSELIINKRLEMNYVIAILPWPLLRNIIDKKLHIVKKNIQFYFKIEVLQHEVKAY